MDSEFWINKWQNGETRFHRSQYHDLLVECGDRLTKGVILVPLCGKSLDMLYLVSKGHAVIGVELSSIACRDFFEENKIEYTTTLVEDFTVFKSDKITLWCGDFFKLPQNEWDKVTGIYDRAALIALPKDVRKAYATEILKRTPKKVEMLLIAIEYLEDALQGPPFSVDTLELKEIYPSFSIQKLSSNKEERLPKDHSKFKSIEITESIYWMEKI